MTSETPPSEHSHDQHHPTAHPPHTHSAVTTLSIDLYCISHLIYLSLSLSLSPCLCVNTFCRLFIISYFVILLCIFSVTFIFSSALFLHFHTISLSFSHLSCSRSDPRSLMFCLLSLSTHSSCKRRGCKCKMLFFH